MNVEGSFENKIHRWKGILNIIFMMKVEGPIAYNIQRWTYLLNIMYKHNYNLLTSNIEVFCNNYG